jgi:hypothetical protein
MTCSKSNFEDDVEKFTGASYGGFERKHFWMCFDCVINEFPYWWHFPDLSLSLPLFRCVSVHFPLLIRIYCFHSRLKIGYWLCGFVILVVFKTNICTSTVFNDS